MTKLQEFQLGRYHVILEGDKALVSYWEWDQKRSFTMNQRLLIFIIQQYHDAINLLRTEAYSEDEVNIHLETQVRIKSEKPIYQIDDDGHKHYHVELRDEMTFS
jgi:hypothetical protein